MNILGTAWLFGGRKSRRLEIRRIGSECICTGVPPWSSSIITSRTASMTKRTGRSLLRHNVGPRIEKSLKVPINAVPVAIWFSSFRVRHKSGPSRRRAATLTFTNQLLPLFSGSGPLFDNGHSACLAPNVDTVVACAEGVDAVNRETSLELKIGLLENEVERLRLQLIVLTKALAKVIRILKRC